MKNRTWVLLFALLLAVFAGVAVFLQRKPAGRIANIYQDGVCIRSIDLSAVTEEYSFAVTDAEGHENLVEVEPGRICIREANCPDQVCVRTGWISDGAKPIVCLPARLTIQLEETSESQPEIDGVVG